MSRLSFALGVNDRLVVDLRSHQYGQPLVRTGKATLHVGSLSCAIDVAFEQRELEAFFEAVRTCHATLRGDFRLRSLDGSVVLEGTMAPHGHARLSVRMNRTINRQRDEPQWELSANFSCAAERLAGVGAGAGAA